MFEGEKMVVILSGKENSAEREITSLLGKLGFGVITENFIKESQKEITVISLKKPCDIVLTGGIVIMTDDTDTFKNQKLPQGMTGVCMDTNLAALKLFKENNVPIITCGTGNKNTLTVSSITEKGLMLSLQRSITDIKGNITEPKEIKTVAANIENYFPILAVTAVMIYYGLPFDGLFFKYQ